MNLILQTHIQVERLRCIDCRLQQIPILKNLVALTLRRCGLTLMALATDGQVLPSLKELDLSSNPLALDVSNTTGLQRLVTSRLRSLDLSDCCSDGCPEVSTAIFDSVRSTVILERLCLAANVFAAADWSRLFSVLPAPSELLDLRYAGVSDNMTTDGDALGTLVASASVVRMGFAQLLASAPQRVRFSASLRLDIRAIAYTPAVQRILCDHAPVLQALDISDNVHISLTNMNTLRALRARRCALSALDVLGIIHSIPSLRLLDVADNIVESSVAAGDKWLDDAVLRLRFLDLSDSNLIAPEDASKLVQAWLSPNTSSATKRKRLAFLKDTTFRLCEDQQTDDDCTFSADILL